jgi:hypothetical protein
MTQAKQLLPSMLRWAVRLLWLEAVVLGLVTVLLCYLAATHPTFGFDSAAATIGFTLFLGLLFALLARSLARRKAWARSPAIVLEMLLVPIGWSMVYGGVIYLGAPVMAAGLAGSVLLLAPSSRTALGIHSVRSYDSHS